MSQLTLAVPDWRLDHWCPTCGAKPGERCRPYSLTQAHLARGSFEDERLDTNGGGDD